MIIGEGLFVIQSLRADESNSSTPMRLIRGATWLCADASEDICDLVFRLFLASFSGLCPTVRRENRTVKA